MRKGDKEKLALRIIFYLVFIYIFLFCLIQFNVFRNFDYHDFDLAIYNQVTWNTLHGNFFYSSIRGGAYFKDHISLILLMVLPLYAILPHPLTLLFLQTVLLGLSAWPIFLLAREELETKLALSLSFIYLIYPAVGNINLFEFHPEAFSVFFLLFTFYYLKKEKFGLFVLFMILALMCKEDISLAVLMLGFYAALVKKSKRWILAPLISGILWFILSIFVIIPHFHKGGYLYTIFYDHLGKNISEIISTIIFRPFFVLKTMFLTYKLRYLAQLFMPVSFLSFFSPLTLSITFPTLARNLLSNYPPTASICCQYTVTLIPFIFISAIYGLKRILKLGMLRARVNGIMLAILSAGLISGWAIGPQLHLSNKITAYTYNRNYLNEAKQKFLSSIPKDASVIATFNFLPKLSCREKLYTFHYVYFGREKVEKEKFILPKDVEYGLIDFEDYLTFYGFYTPQGAENMLRFFKEGNWGIVKIVDNVALFKRNYLSQYRLSELIDNPAAAYHRREIEINRQLVFLGYNLNQEEADRIPLLHLSLYWKTKEKVLNDHMMIITIADEQNRVLVRRPQKISYNIYLMPEWKVGEIIKTDYWVSLPLNSHSKGYRIILSVLEKSGRIISQFLLNP